MKITHKHTVDFFDVAHDKTMRIEAMARVFQDIAIRHSSRVGAGPDQLFPKGQVWFLHRLEVRVLHYPVLGDEIVLTSWSRAFRQYMGLREYTIESDLGIAVQASAVWVFFDFQKKRVIRAPEAMMAAYESEPRAQFDDELYQWQPEKVTMPEIRTDITLRHGDFDINGHVNNTIYPGLVETLGYSDAMEIPDNSSGRIRHLKLRLGREIPLGTKDVNMGCCQIDRRNCFAVTDTNDPAVIHADGELSF